VDAQSGSASDDALWLKGAVDSLSTLYTSLSAADKLRVLVAAILYQSPVPGNPHGSLNALQCSTFFSGAATYFKAFNPYYLSDDGNPAGPAARFYNGMTGTVTPPFTYVIWRSTARISDKIHRGCRYSGESAYAPKADLIRLDWDTSAATNAVMLDYLTKRLVDHTASVVPMITTRPLSADNLFDGGDPRVKNGSRVKFSFSEKVVGAAVNTKFVINDGSSNRTDLIAPVSDYDVTWAAYTAASPTQSEQGLERQFVNPPNAPLTLVSPSSTLVDTTGVGFQSSAAFVGDAAGDAAGYPRVEVVLHDGPGTDYDISAGGIPKALTHAARSLTVRVLTAYPNPEEPRGVLKRPGAADVVLNFVHYAAEVDAAELANEGVYTLILDEFTNNAAQTVGQTVRRFVVATNLAANTNLNAVEGWGYYPREELLPSNAAESALGVPGVNPWVEEGGAATISSGLGMRLGISVAAGVSKTYRRASPSPALYGSAADPGFPGNGVSYVEAGLRVPTYTQGPVRSVRDQNGNPLSLRMLGVGLELWNGPFIYSVFLVDASTTPAKDVRLAVRIFHPSEERYKLSAATLDLGSKSFLIRAQFDSGQLKVYCVELGTPIGASAPVITASLDELPHDSASGVVYQSGVRFGVLGIGNSTLSTEWEFVRYGFMDAAYLASLNDTSLIGIAHTKRSGEADFYRSTDIHIGAVFPDSADPVPGDNSVKAILSCGTLPSLTANLPYKVRFFTADWDDTGGAASALGFLKANFPSCYQTYGASSPGFTAMPTSPAGGRTVFAQRAVPGTAAFEVGSVTWPFDLSPARTARRLFILVYVDSPLMPAPALLPGVSVSSLLSDDDGAAKADKRCAVRQFLPDFYVRDNETDLGTSPGGSLSPDLAMAVFPGDPVTHALPNPQVISGVINQQHYPRGFARGDPVPYDYKPTGYTEIESTLTDPAVKPIKLVDSGWSDSATNCYYNRVWVRLSNRGVVPGPAKVQVFFLGSTLRAHFDPLLARGHGYDDIYAVPSTDYVQTKFQLYTGGVPSMVDYIPALSGASDPATPKNFAIAEFVWHVSLASVPTDSSDSHGCRAACINLRENGGAWTSGVDTAPAIVSSNSIWSADLTTNNISVRNSNIVQGDPPGSGDTVTVKAVIRDDSPVTYKRLPNDFRPTFPRKQQANWGLAVDAGKFKEGSVVLRVAAALIEKQAIVKNMTELFPEKDGERITSLYRFFQIKGGDLGLIEGLRPAEFNNQKERPEKLPASIIRVFFQPRPRAKPGMYEITLRQTADGKRVGSYRTVIAIPALREMLFIGDERTKVAYERRTSKDLIRAIPYENRAIFTGAGLAVQEGYRLTPLNEVKLMTGELENEIVNVPKAYKFPHRPEELPVLPGGLIGAVVGRLVDPKGRGIPGLTVVLSSEEAGRELGRGLSDHNGRYLIRVKTQKKKIPAVALKHAVAVRIFDREGGSELYSEKMKVDELCFAMKEITIEKSGKTKKRLAKAVDTAVKRPLKRKTAVAGKNPLSKTKSAVSAQKKTLSAKKKPASQPKKAAQKQGPSGAKTGKPRRPSQR
jgi:hypothetical protein